jgi:hypothetical protein
MEWYYTDNGQQVGPVPDAELDNLVKAGKITPDTFVWKEGMEGWKPLSEVRPPAGIVSPKVEGVGLQSALELRPLRLPELLDRIFRLYRQHFFSFFLISAVGMLLTFILSGVVYWVFGVFDVIQGNPEVITKHPEKFFSALFVTIGLLVPIQMMMLSAVTIAVSRSYLGLPFNMVDCYRLGLKSFGGLLWTSILSGIFIMLGFICCIIPGVFLAISFLLVSEVVVLENLNGMPALKRSWELLRKKSEKGIFKNNIWKISVIGVIYLVISAVIGTIANIPGFIMGLKQGFASHEGTLTNFPIWMVLLSQFCSVLAKSITYPIGAIGFILLYYDIRIRFEAFDLQLLSQSMQSREDKS